MRATAPINLIKCFIYRKEEVIAIIYFKPLIGNALYIVKDIFNPVPLRIL